MDKFWILQIPRVYFQFKHHHKKSSIMIFGQLLMLFDSRESKNIGRAQSK